MTGWSLRSLARVCSLGILGAAAFAVALETRASQEAEAPGDRVAHGQVAHVPSATELVERSIEYHDPGGRFLSEAHRLRFLETRPGGQARRSQVLIDIPGERFEMERAGEHVIAGVLDPERCEMTLDGRAEVSDQEREQHRISCDRIRLMRNYYTFLWGLPMKLQDPGVRLGAVREIEFQDRMAKKERPVYELKVTFEDNVGEDIWYFYFDRQSFALMAYRFYHDEQKGDGEVIYLEGETEFEGLRLPARRTWFTHLDDRELGTDELVAINRPGREPGR